MLVHSMKEPLRKVLAKALFWFQELATVLTRIEAVSDDVRDLTPITPTHFALGRSLFNLPDLVDEVLANEGTMRQQCLYQQKLVTISGDPGEESTCSSYPSDRSV